MPWKVFGNCVHKLNSDGSKGKLVACHDTPAKAAAQARALYASEDKMKKEKLREKRRAQRLHQKEVKEARNKALLDDVEEIDEDELEEEELAIEGTEETIEEDELQEELVQAAKKEKGLIQKDDHPMSMPMNDMAMPQMDMGPVSWDELDAQKVADEQADALEEVTWDARRLVSHILGHPMMNPDEQTKALKAVAAGFGDRAKNAMNMTEKALEDDIELLELDALIAKDDRSTSPAEKVQDWITKKLLSGSARKKLPDSAFALPSKRKYPIHDKAHVRNAMARASQMMKRGGEMAADAKAAMPAIRAAAKKFGIGSVNKSVSSVIVEKDAKGNWRAVMWPSNNFKDLDGDIISEKAHLEYVNWVNKNMDCAPAFITWHTPGTAREHQVDFVTYENGFLIMSAPLTEKEAAMLLKAQQITDLGMSHGSFVLERAPENEHIIEKYRMVEVSDLPLENAANPFTDFQILTKEVDMNKKEYLTSLLGPEWADRVMEKTEMKQEELRKNGVEEKEKSEPQPVTTATTPTPAPDTQAIVDQVLKELDIDGLQDFLAKAQENAEKIPVLEAAVKAMKQGQDETLAEMISPKAGRKFLWSKERPSTKDDNLLKDNETEDAKLKESVAQLPEDWATMGITPLQN